MKYILKNIGIAAIIFILGFAAGLFLRNTPEPLIVTETKVEWKDKVIYREYEKMEYPEIMKKLKLYDTSEPRLHIYQIKNDEIKADAGLCERNWTGTAKIHQNKNYQYYIGVGAVCLLAGAALAMAVK